MQLRLSTIFLLCVIIGIGLGWFIDRTTLAHHGTKQRKSLESRSNNTRVAMFPYVRARNTFFIAKDHRVKTPREFAADLEYDLVWSLFQLYLHHEEIGSALDDSEEPLDLAGAILGDLNCKSAEEFFSLVESAKFDRAKKRKSASLLDDGHPGRDRFRRFIEDAAVADGYAWANVSTVKSYEGPDAN